jgi:hypothetical protein
MHAMQAWKTLSRSYDLFRRVCVGAGPGLCPALVESDGRQRSSSSWSSTVYSDTVDTLNDDKDPVVFVQKRVHAVQRTVLFCFLESRGCAT